MMTVSFLISYNQAFIRELAISQIKSRIQGDVTLGSITPAFFKAFPDIAVNLHDLTIRDSMWDQHKNDFLKAKNIYLYLSWVSLFKGKPEVKKVTIEDVASVYRKDNDTSEKIKKIDLYQFIKDGKEREIITALNYFTLLTNLKWQK